MEPENYEINVQVKDKSIVECGVNETDTTPAAFLVVETSVEGHIKQIEVSLEESELKELLKGIKELKG